MRKYLVIYEEAVSHIWLCTQSFWISSYMRKILFSFYQCTFMLSLESAGLHPLPPTRSASTAWNLLFLSRRVSSLCVAARIFVNIGLNKLRDCLLKVFPIHAYVYTRFGLEKPNSIGDKYRLLRNFLGCHVCVETLFRLKRMDISEGTWRLIDA